MADPTPPPVPGVPLPFEPRPDPRPGAPRWPDVTWPPPSTTVLTGAVVELRPTTVEDTLDLFVALDDDRAWEHLRAEHPYRVHVLRDLVSRRLEQGFPWTVRLRSTGAVVGWTSFVDTSVEDARTELGATQYAPAVWGTAVNPETKLLLLGLAFDELGFGRVQLKTDVRNVRSQRAIARLGATFEGVLRHHQRRQDGSLRDTVLFSVTADDWPRVRDGLPTRVAQAVASRP